MWVSLLVDATLAVGAYLTAYWLRFPRDQLELFLPSAKAALPFVVPCQLAALAAARAYARWPAIDWLMRVIAGIAVGTATGAAVVGLFMGFGGMSRVAFVADALLLSLAAIGWRSLWVLKARSDERAHARAIASATGGDLIDRAAETPTFRAVITSLYTYRELLKNLVLKDLKLKYRGSVFGFLWSLFNPLLMMVVYTIAFTYILRVRSEGFVFSLMLGLLTWTFFAGSAAMSTGAIVDNSGLLKSVLFPRAILPISTVVFNLTQYLLTLAVFLPLLMLWYHVPPSITVVALPAFLALHLVLTIGVALFLATATAFFRDVRHLLEVALAVLFWTTPILYELKQVPERLQLPVLLSPVSPFVVAYQQILYYRAWPDGTVWLLAAVHAFGAFAIGGMLFVTYEHQFTEQL